MNTIRVRVVAFQDSEGHWVAQCLEHDIAAQAGSLADLQYEIERVLVSHLVISQKLGRRPFEGLSPAPVQFERMYEDSRESLERKEPSFGLPEGLRYHLAPDVKVSSQTVLQ